MTELIQYKLLDGNIHNFVWLQNNHETTTQYVEHFGKIVRDSLPSDANHEPIVIRVLLDFRQTTFPSLDTILPGLIDQRRRNELIESRFHAYFAYLSDDVEFIENVRSAVSIMPPSNNRQFFKADEEQKAIEWLLKSE